MPAKYLKHKPPILLLDSVVSIDAMNECVATIELNSEKWFFQCHYPEYPVMPGSLLIEAMSQAATILISPLGRKDEVPLISEVTKAVFKREVIPGAQLRVLATLQSTTRGVSKVKCQCECINEVACFCTFTMVTPSVLRQFTRSD